MFILLFACSQFGLTPYTHLDTAERGIFDEVYAEADTDTGTDTDTDTDTDADVVPRLPGTGDLVISEIMANPSAVIDPDGEWVELVNTSGDVLDVSGLYLSDEGVDGCLVEYVGTLAPGEYLVLCGQRSSSLNGGVACDGGYTYLFSGGGFALSNSQDEVILSLDDGTLLDEFRYQSSDIEAGVSLGVDDACLSESENDNEGCWCSQSGWMSGGDLGNPGAPNVDC